MFPVNTLLIHLSVIIWYYQCYSGSTTRPCEPNIVGTRLLIILFIIDQIFGIFIKFTIVTLEDFLFPLLVFLFSEPENRYWLVFRSE